MSQSPRLCRLLTAKQVQLLYATNIGGANSIPTQPTLLESAVDSPISVKHYTGETNLFKLAAVLAEKIMKNHAFMDGNKRTALVAADIFLRTNGCRLQVVALTGAQTNHGLADAHVAVTTGSWDADKLAEYYEDIAHPVEPTTPEIDQTS